MCPPRPINLIVVLNVECGIFKNKNKTTMQFQKLLNYCGFVGCVCTLKCKRAECLEI